MKAVILCGGLGTRLKDYIGDEPKGLVPLKNGTLLGLIIQNLRTQGVHNLYLAIGHGKEKVMGYFGDSVSYLQENEPLGTGGFLSLIDIGKFTEPFFVVNGDCLFKANLGKMMQAHKKNEACVTIAAVFKEVTDEYGLLQIHNSFITSFDEKKANAGSGWINSGYYIFNPKVIDLYKGKIPLSLEKQVFPHIAKMNKLFAYKTNGEWHDVGTPERMVKAYGWRAD